MYKFLPILLFAYCFAVTTEDIYDNSYALIIGIDKYKNVQNLNYAVKDAESIQDILVNTFDFPEGNVTLLKNEEANKQAILKAFSDLTKKAENNDRVLIYFAGHGETMELTEGGERGYLLPVDGNKEDLYLSSIGMDELEDISEMSKAKHTLYLVDACYGGIAAVGSRGLDASSTPNYIDKITKNRAVQIITAGGRGEQVIEKPKWGHSAFTLNLNRGLKDGNADMNADGYITANELGMFLSEKVTFDSDNQQTPQYGRMTTQEGEFVFVYSEKTIINQQADTSSDDEFQALVLDKLDKLEKQAAKTKPDLIVNPDMQQSNYPLIHNWMYAGGILWGAIEKQRDKRAVIGFGLNHKRYSDDWAGEFVDVTEISLVPYLGYYLTPRRTDIFNPFISFALALSLEKRKCETLQLNDTGEKASIALALVNKVKVDEDFGFSFGYQALWTGIQGFNDDGNLYVDRYRLYYNPTFSLDHTLSKKYYGALSSLDRISLRERKKNDLINFSIWYGITVLGHYWYNDGTIFPVLIIPAIGPFIVLYEHNMRGWENISLLSGVQQTYYLIDYIRTSKKLKGLNNNISYQINLNPIAPSVKFTYDFD